MSIRLKDSSSVAGGGPLVFSAVSKEELQTITDFLSMKKIKLKNEMDELAQAEAVAALDVSSDEDEAMASSDENSDGGARSRRKKKAVGVDAMDLDEDEDSEGTFLRLVPAPFSLSFLDAFADDTRACVSAIRAVDEDFQADSDSDGGSASSDDSDSDDGGAVSGDEVAKEPKKKKQKTAK